MLETLSSIAPYLLTYKYVALFVLMYLSAAFLPIPGGLVSLTAGALSATGHMELALALLIALGANVLGDLSGYAFMRFFGNRYGKRLEDRSRAFHTIGIYLRRRPITTVALSRFVGFATTQTNFLAGMSRTPVLSFVIGDTLGNAVCIGAYVIAGYVATELGDSLASVVAVLGGIFLAFGVLSVAGFLYLNRNRKESAMPATTRSTPSA